MAIAQDREGFDVTRFSGSYEKLCRDLFSVFFFISNLRAFNLYHSSSVNYRVVNNASRDGKEGKM